MHPIIYDVAVSIDGYISGSNGDISRFAQEGPVVEDYFKRLSEYTVAIMGRNTYEFGYRFGLVPGANPYKHMKTLIFSKSIDLPDDREVSVVDGDEVSFLRSLKQTSGGPIYLCGGGAFAGSLLAEGLIDIVRLKRAPIILGEGVPLFGSSSRLPDLTNTRSHLYDGGYVFQEFEVRN